MSFGVSAGRIVSGLKHAISGSACGLYLNPVTEASLQCEIILRRVWSMTDLIAVAIDVP